MKIIAAKHEIGLFVPQTLAITFENQVELDSFYRLLGDCPHDKRLTTVGTVLRSMGAK